MGAARDYAQHRIHAAGQVRHRIDDPPEDSQHTQSEHRESNRLMKLHQFEFVRITSRHIRKVEAEADIDEDQRCNDPVKRDRDSAVTQLCIR